MLLFTDGNEHLFQIRGPDFILADSKLSEVTIDFFEDLLEIDANLSRQCVGRCAWFADPDFKVPAKDASFGCVFLKKLLQQVHRLSTCSFNFNEETFGVLILEEKSTTAAL